MNSLNATRRCSVIGIMATFLFVFGIRGQDANLCHEMCTEEKTSCDRDCNNVLLNIEAKTCMGQCVNDMSSCFDRCNNMVNLEHVISDHTSKDIVNVRQETIEPISSDFADVNFLKLSSQKIKPQSSTVPSDSTDVDAKLEVRKDEALCLESCVSKEVDCELQCFIDFSKNMVTDNDCSAMCKRNKNICIETCSPPQYIIQSEPKDFVVATPNRITSLGMTVQSPSLENSDTDMTILQRILMGLPTEGTQIIGNWRL